MAGSQEQQVTAPLLAQFFEADTVGVPIGRVVNGNGCFSSFHQDDVVQPSVGASDVQDARKRDVFQLQQRGGGCAKGIGLKAQVQGSIAESLQCRSLGGGSADFPYKGNGQSQAVVRGDGGQASWSTVLLVQLSYVPFVFHSYMISTLKKNREPSLRCPADVCPFPLLRHLQHTFPVPVIHLIVLSFDSLNGDQNDSETQDHQQPDGSVIQSSFLAGDGG